MAPEILVIVTAVIPAAVLAICAANMSNSDDD